MSESNCYYCNNSLLTPLLLYNKLIEKSVKIYNKTKCIKNFNLLQSYVRVSSDLELYIYYKYNDLYKRLGPAYFSNSVNKEPAFNLTNVILYENRKKYGSDIAITCNFCKSHGCVFHSLYSGFVNTKCDTCFKFISKCGWCVNNELALFMYTNKCVSCYNIYNSKIKNIIENNKIIENNNNILLNNLNIYDTDINISDFMDL